MKIKNKSKEKTNLNYHYHPLLFLLSLLCRNKNRCPTTKLSWITFSLLLFLCSLSVAESFLPIVPASPISIRNRIRNFLNIKRQERQISSSSSSSSSSAIIDNENNMTQKKDRNSNDNDDDDDTKTFLDYASAAVDITSAHFVPQSGIISVIRSVRDLDNECRKQYLYQIPFHSTTTTTTTTTTSNAGDNTINDTTKAFRTSALSAPTLMDSTIQIRIPSPSGSKLFIVKKMESKNNNSGGGGSNNNFVMEVWQGDALTMRIPIQQQSSNNNVSHGSIISDPTGFGIPTWSPDESCILYSAERKPIQTKSYWDYSSSGGSGGGGGSGSKGTAASTTDTVIRGGKHVLGQGTMEDWGEKLSTQAPILDLYILNVETGKRERVANVPKPATTTTSNSNGDITLGQAVWHPSGNQIAYTGWDAGGLGTMARRLGMIFCRNRPSKVYISNVSNLMKRLHSNNDDGDNDEYDGDDDCTCVTPDFAFSRSPQFISKSNDNKEGEQQQQQQSSLVFLANPKGFVSHDGCMGLYQWDNEEEETTNVTTGKAPKCIVPVVDIPSNKDPPTLHGIGFPGLFLSQLPPCCGIGNDGRYMVTATVWGSFQRLIRIDLSSSAVHLIDIEGLSSLSSYSLLCKLSNDGDEWIISEIALNQPAKLWHVEGFLNDSDPNDNGIVRAKARLLYEFSSIAASSFSIIKPKFDDIPIDLKVYSIPPPVIDGIDSDDDTPIQALVMIPRRRNGEKVPLVVIPHGGPHSCTVSSYAPGFAYLANHYAVVFPNYRGSTGFGQTALESLMTRIGEVDVQDVMACAHHVLQEESDSIDTSRVGICGGSHGGFLTAHCTGQFPTFFRAAVMRNPVTNIATMVTATDIADWCYAETFGSGIYDTSKFRGPTLEELSKMYEKSPIVHVDKVQTPTLIGLGMVDLRVPPSQGKEWYYTLRSAGVDTKLLVYPDDCHALDRVTTEADHWIHIKQWFDRYFQQEQE